MKKEEILKSINEAPHKSDLLALESKIEEALENEEINEEEADELWQAYDSRIDYFEELNWKDKDEDWLEYIDDNEFFEAVVNKLGCEPHEIASWYENVLIYIDKPMDRDYLPDFMLEEIKDKKEPIGWVSKKQWKDFTGPLYGNYFFDWETYIEENIDYDPDFKIKLAEKVIHDSQYTIDLTDWTGDEIGQIMYYLKEKDLHSSAPDENTLIVEIVDKEQQDKLADFLNKLNKGEN